MQNNKKLQFHLMLVAENGINLIKLYKNSQKYKKMYVTNKSQLVANKTLKADKKILMMWWNALKHLK